ncbi:unnamed protein product [Prunus armeniaca]
MKKSLGGGEAIPSIAKCHGSHIDKCYRDSVGTSMRLRGSLSVEGRALKRLQEEPEEAKNTEMFVMSRRRKRN